MIPTRTRQDQQQSYIPSDYTQAKFMTLDHANNSIYSQPEDSNYMSAK